MQEIEVKILDIDKDNIIKKIESLGAVKIFDGLVETAYFDTPDKKLCKDHKTLRLRKRGTLYELTLKEKVSKAEAKIMNEYEVTVENYEVMMSVLNGLGFQQYLSLSKHRLSYSLNDIHFEIDKYNGKYKDIPPFLEIEAPSIDALKTYVLKIGFSWSDAKPWSSKDVLSHYSK